MLSSFIMEIMPQSPNATAAVEYTISKVLIFKYTT